MQCSIKPSPCLEFLSRCFSRFSSALSISPSKDFRASSSLHAFTSCQFSSSRSWFTHRLPRFVAKATDPDNVFGDDSFGFFPCSDADNEIQWVPEERVTLFTADGLIQIGDFMVPRRVSSSDKKQGKFKTAQRFQRFQESDYMDPNQVGITSSRFHLKNTFFNGEKGQIECSTTKIEYKNVFFSPPLPAFFSSQ